MENLAITTLTDSRDSRFWRNCGKLWAASLLRHQWAGQIRIYRDFPEPLLPIERKVLQEIHLNGRGAVDQLWEEETVQHYARYKWILFADADCVAIRNLDHLFVGESDILLSQGPNGVDTGFFAVKGDKILEFARHLRASGKSPGETLGSTLRDSGFKCGRFERGEIVRPADPSVSLADIASAAVIHLSGLPPKDKHRFAFAFHMMSVYHSEDGLFFDLLEV